MWLISVQLFHIKGSSETRQKVNELSAGRERETGGGETFHNSIQTLIREPQPSGRLSESVSHTTHEYSTEDSNESSSMQGIHEEPNALTFINLADGFIQRDLHGGIQQVKDLKGLVIQPFSL